MNEPTAGSDERKPRAPDASAPSAPTPAPPGRGTPFDSFAGRLDKALKQTPQSAGATPQPSGPAPAKGPSPFDSFAGRLGKALTAAKDAPSPDEAPAEAPPPSSQGPVGAGEHVVKQGECISSIARDAGHLWETIWNDPANADLRNARKDPNVLLPDDRVYVPPLREKWAPGQTEQRHRFQRHGEPAVLRLTLLIDDVPLANAPYTLDVDSRSIVGTTDAEGKLERAIPNNARHGRLVVGTEKKWEYTLNLGHIDPVENLAGVQKRLINLGFYCGRTDGTWDEQCASACREFQKQQGLNATGDPDDLTREKLKAAHGS